MDINHKPKKLDCLKIIGTNPNKEVVFLDPNTPNWVALNPFLSLFLCMCDGKRNLLELSEFFDFSKTNHDHTYESTANVVDYLQRKGVLEKSNGTPQCASSQYHDLQMVCLYLTNACNLRCRHCFASAGRTHTNELTTQEILRLIDDLAKMNVKELCCFGGEPLLRKDVFELCHRGKENGITVSLITNGTLIDRHMATKIGEAFDKVQVSLDGLEHQNDALRGQGSFAEAVQGIIHLLNCGVEVVVNTVISKYNIDTLVEYVGFLAKIGVPYFHCTNLQGCGRGSSLRSKTVPLTEFASSLIKVSEKWKNKIAVNQIPAIFEFTRHEKKLNCGVANGNLEIDSRGNVYPCYQLMQEDFIAGSIRTQSINEIYTDSPVLQRRRSYSVDDDLTCRSCDIRYICGSGCLAKKFLSIDECKEQEMFVYSTLTR